MTMQKTTWMLATLLAIGIVATAFATPTSLVAQVDAVKDSGLPEIAFRQLLARIDAEGTPALKAKAYMLRCHDLVGGDPEAMRSVADAGIAIASRVSADAALGGLLVCRGYIEERAGHEDRAYADYDAAIVASTRAGDREGIAQGRVMRGEIQHGRGNYTDALQDMQAAYRSYVELGNEPQQRYTLNAIANLYADPRVGQYDQALDYYRQTLKSNEAAGDHAGIATAHYNIGSTLERIQKFPEALASFRAALAGYTAEGDTDSVADTHRAMATMLLRMNRPAEALPLAEQALRHAMAGGDANFIARVRLTRGTALHRLGRIDEGLADLDAARLYFEGEDNPRFLEHIAGERADALARSLRWQQAYEARSSQLALGNRLDKQSNEELTSRLRVQFDSEHKEQENIALQRENELRSRALADGERIRGLQAAVIGLGSLLLIGVIWWASRAAKRAAQMRRLALTDELTGLPNRRAIFDQLRQRLRGRDAAATALMIFDIDHFKRINDGLGHDAGDLVLRQVASVARKALRDDGDVGRIGGEEFLVLLRSSDREQASVIGERLRMAVEAIVFDGPAQGLHVTISLGGSIASPDDAMVEEAVKRADLALYRAKEDGRNRMEWHMPAA